MKSRFSFRKNTAYTGCWILFFLLVFNTKAPAQLYLDVWAGYDFYQFDKPLNLKNNRIIYLPRIGVSVFQSQDKRIKISAEGGPFIREFYQEFPGKKFQYRFNGWFASPVVSYQAFKNTYFDGGFDFLFYKSRINGYGLVTPIGRGFSGFDVGFIAGGSYYFAEWFAAGIRYTPYIIKMLHYERIGAYGNFEPLKKDISSQRLEFFIRLQILNSMNK